MDVNSNENFRFTQICFKSSPCLAPGQQTWGALLREPSFAWWISFSFSQPTPSHKGMTWLAAAAAALNENHHWVIYFIFAMTMKFIEPITEWLTEWLWELLLDSLGVRFFVAKTNKADIGRHKRKRHIDRGCEIGQFVRLQITRFRIIRTWGIFNDQNCGLGKELSIRSAIRKEGMGISPCQNCNRRIGSWIGELS